MAVNRDYLTHDAALILPVSQLGMEYTAASVSSHGAPSQLAVVAYADSLVDLVLPRKGNFLNQYFARHSHVLDELEVAVSQLTGR